MCNSKGIKICPTQHVDFLGILFIDDSLKTKKGLGLVSRSLFSYNFWRKKVIL